MAKACKNHIHDSSAACNQVQASSQPAAATTAPANNAKAAEADENQWTRLALELGIPEETVSQGWPATNAYLSDSFPLLIDFNLALAGQTYLPDAPVTVAEGARSYWTYEKVQRCYDQIVASVLSSENAAFFSLADGKSAFLKGIESLSAGDKLLVKVRASFIKGLPQALIIVLHNYCQGKEEGSVLSTKDYENLTRADEVVSLEASELVKIPSFFLARFNRFDAILLQVSQAGASQFDWFQCDNTDPSGNSLLHYAASNARLDFLELFWDTGKSSDPQLQRQFKAFINVQNKQSLATPLHFATIKADCRLIAYLVSKGADPSIADSEGHNCLFYSVQYGHPEVLSYYVQVVGMDVNQWDSANRTLLHWSCFKANSTEAVQLLLKLGIDIKASFRMHCEHLDYGKVSMLAKGIGEIPITALSFAVDKRMSHLVTMLLKNGADPVRDLATDDERFALSAMIYPRLTSCFGSAATLPLVRSKFSGFWDPLVSFFSALLGPLVFLPAIFVVLGQWDMLYSGPIAIGILALFVLLHNVLLSLARDEGKSNWLFTGLVNASNIWGAVVYVMAVMPALNTLNFLPLHIIFGIIFVSAMALFYSCIFSNPGTIKKNPDLKREIQKVAESGLLKRRTFCTTCSVKRPIRSKHCAICDHCVNRFDHHCVWLHNCIGLNNYARFFSFVIAQFVLMLYFCIAASFAINYVQAGSIVNLARKNEPYYGIRWIQMLYVCLPWSVLNTLWLPFLLIQHLVLVSRNLTTNENINKTRYTYLHLKEKKAEESKSLEKKRHALDQGCRLNAREMLCTRSSFSYPLELEDQKSPISDNAEEGALDSFEDIQMHSITFPEEEGKLESIIIDKN